MLSKTAVYALRAIASLAELDAGEFAGAGDLADRLGAPRNYLGKLLRTLADAGIVESQKGKGGGFRLAMPPERVAVYDVVEPIDHVSRWRGCFLGRSRCSEKSPCAVHLRWAGVRDQYLRFLCETTVADLLQKSDRQPQL